MILIVSHGDGACRRRRRIAAGKNMRARWAGHAQGYFFSHLKHGYGWDRTRMDGMDGARIWCVHGVLAHNLVKTSGLVAAKQQRRAA